jgi:hypothetical protein
VYCAAESFQNGFAAVKAQKKWGFINRLGEMVIPAMYDSTAIGFNDGLCFVSKKQDIGVIDELGNTRIPFVFKSGLLGDCFEYSFRNQLAYAVLNREKGHVNEDGLIVEHKQEKLIHNPSTGFIDKHGKVKVPFVYNHCWHFSEGLAPVFSDQGAGYVNEEGDEIIPLIYKDAISFKDGFAVVGI